MTGTGSRISRKRNFLGNSRKPDPDVQRNFHRQTVETECCKG